MNDSPDSPYDRPPYGTCEDGSGGLRFSREGDQNLLIAKTGNGWGGYAERNEYDKYRGREGMVHSIDLMTALAIRYG